MAKGASLSRQNNSVNIAEGQSIRVNGGHGLYYLRVYHTITSISATYNFTDVKSMTQSLVAGSVSISVPDRSSFDIKA